MRWLAGSFQKVDYIIQVDYTPIEVEVPQAGFYQAAEWYGSGIGQFKRHSVTLIESQQPYCECSQQFAFLDPSLDLPVPQTSGQARRTIGTPASCQGSHQCGVVASRLSLMV